MTDDKSGRPICFVFAGKTNLDDGASARLDAKLLRKSVNFAQMKAGLAYPLYYNTLFSELRKVFEEARVAAQGPPALKNWKTDATNTGVTVKKKADLSTIPPVWPKLWRRLQTHFGKNTSLKGFIAFLEKENERIDILSTGSEKGLQDIVKVAGNRVSLTVKTHDIRVRGKAALRRG